MVGGRRMCYEKKPAGSVRSALRSDQLQCSNVVVTDAGNFFPIRRRGTVGEIGFQPQIYVPPM